MFRCEFCENYRDKSECCENPEDPNYGNICEECADVYAWELLHPEECIEQADLANYLTFAN